MIALLATSAKAAAPGLGHPKHLGVASCASSLCHGSAKPTTAYSVAQNEYVTWSHFDPHARAYEALLGDRAAVIVRRMSLPPAYEAPACLGCHTDNVSPGERGPRFQITDGIGCERCHGAAENWIASHDDAPKVTHAENLASGLTMLERPSVRAGICLDCHVGNDSELANHRMMAAGHPRLTFELDTFTELWRTSGGREHYRVDADYRQRKAVATPVETWSAGLVAKIERQQQLIRGPQFHAGAVFPELALFNCYSCHRQMRLKRWADKVGGDLAPGSLRFDNASLRMMEALMVAREPAPLDALRENVRAWQAAATDSRETVVSRSDAIEAIVRGVGERTAARPWTKAEIRAALDDLLAGAKRGDYPDYTSAEQCAMSIVVLLAELGEDRRRDAAIDDLFKVLEDDDRYDAGRFRQILDRLK